MLNEEVLLDTEALWLDPCQLESHAAGCLISLHHAAANHSCCRLQVNSRITVSLIQQAAGCIFCLRYTANHCCCRSQVCSRNTISLTQQDHKQQMSTRFTFYCTSPLLLIAGCFQEHSQPDTAGSEAAGWGVWHPPGAPCVTASL